MIRWRYLLPRLALLGLIWLFFAFAFDTLLRRGLEKAGSAALGAKVEIGDLKTSFFPPSLRLTRFAAADPGSPMQNLVEFREARFALEGRPLLERKLVIQTARLTGLTWASARKSSGALPNSPPSKLAGKLGEWAQQSKEISFAALARAKEDAKERITVKPEELKSTRLAEELQTRWPKAAQDWKAKAEGFDARRRIKELEGLAREIQSGDPLSRAAKLAELAKKVEGLKREAEQIRKDIEAEAAKALADLEAVKKAMAADLEELRARLNLPSFDPERLSAYLLGQESAARLQKLLRLVETARRKMPPKGAPREPAPGRGVTVQFPKERGWPSFWLKAAKLEGSAELGGPLEFSGEALDLSSDPSLVGRPAKLEFAGTQGSRRVRLSALFDHTKEIARSEISFDYTGLPMPAFTAGDPGSFAVSVGTGTAQLSGSLVLNGPSLSGTIRYRQSGVRLTPSSTGNETVARLAAAAFKGIQELDAELVLGGTLEEPRFSVRSNLGSALAAGLKAALGQEAQARLAEAQAQLSKLVDSKVQSLKSQLDGNLAGAIGVLGLDQIQELQERLKKPLSAPIGLPKIFGR